MLDLEFLHRKYSFLLHALDIDSLLKKSLNSPKRTLFRLFLVRNRACSKVKASESNFDRHYCGLPIPGQPNVKKFWSYHFPVFSVLAPTNLLPIFSGLAAFLGTMPTFVAKMTDIC